LPTLEIKEKQARFRLFMAQGQTKDQFSATFPSEEGQIKVQILLARITEKSEECSERLALVRIMPGEMSGRVSHGGLAPILMPVTVLT
jgi:hypothetical protein